MAALINPRHEQFAQMIAAGENPTQSYAKVFKVSASNGAPQSSSRLLKRADVVRRVEELKGAVAAAAVKGAALTRESVLNRLQVLSTAAQEAGQMSAAIRAEELRGKELGMFVDRSNSKVELDQKNLSELSPAALEEILKALRKRAAQAVPAEEKSEVGGEVVQ